MGSYTRLLLCFFKSYLVLFTSYSNLPKFPVWNPIPKQARVLTSSTFWKPNLNEVQTHNWIANICCTRHSLDQLFWWHPFHLFLFSNRIMCTGYIDYDLERRKCPLTTRSLGMDDAIKPDIKRPNTAPLTADHVLLKVKEHIPKLNLPEML